MSSSSLPIIIAGAGPGGLTLALSLYARGIPCVVCEAVPELKPLGVGINLLPHSVRVLHQLGLAPHLDRIGIRTAALSYYNKHGQLIWSEPRGIAAGYQFPQYSIHRGELQLAVLAAARERLGADALLTGCALEDWSDGADSIAVRFRTADGSPKELHGRCLIAADGIHSAARRKLYPDEGPPLYSGRILWRATTEAAPFLGGSTMVMCGHEDQKFVCYPISRSHAERGRALVNWIGELRVPDWSRPKQDWNRAVTADRFASHFADWRFPWLDLQALIAGAEQIFEYPMVDRDPLPRWTHGRMTLLGDAAHPMYPIGSNGASQAILDAECLAANIVAHPGDASAALAAYEAIRRPATAQIVLLNRQNGPEQVMQLAESRAPNGFNHVHDVIPQDELEAIAQRYKRAAGFALDQVNR